MNDHLAAQISAQFPFHPVHGVMKGQHILFGRNFRVKGNHAASGAVVVNNQIVYAQNIRMVQNMIFNLRHKFRRGRRAKKRVHSRTHGLHSGPENHAGNQKTRPAVQRQVCVPARGAGEQNHGGCSAVPQGV